MLRFLRSTISQPSPQLQHQLTSLFAPLSTPLLLATSSLLLTSANLPSNSLSSLSNPSTCLAISCSNTHAGSSSIPSASDARIESMSALGISRREAR